MEEVNKVKIVYEREGEGGIMGVDGLGGRMVHALMVTLFSLATAGCRCLLWEFHLIYCLCYHVSFPEVELFNQPTSSSTVFFAKPA